MQDQNQFRVPTDHGHDGVADKEPRYSAFETRDVADLLPDSGLDDSTAITAKGVERALCIL